MTSKTQQSVQVLSMFEAPDKNNYQVQNKILTQLNEL